MPDNHARKKPVVATSADTPPIPASAGIGEDLWGRGLRPRSKRQTNATVIGKHPAATKLAQRAPLLRREVLVGWPNGSESRIGRQAHCCHISDLHDVPATVRRCGYACL